MTRQESLAWAAGIIDGEGCIGIDYKRKPKEYRHPSYRLRLRVNMTHKSTLIKLKNILGTGNVKIRPFKKYKHYKTQYGWSVNGNQARKILKVLLPYLHTKIRDAKIGIKFRDFMNGVVTPGRGSYPLSVVRRQHKFYLRLRAVKT